MEAPPSGMPATTKLPPEPSKKEGKRIFAFLMSGFLGLLIGAGLVFTSYRLGLIQNLIVAPAMLPAPTPLPMTTPTSNLTEGWERTTLLGRGLAFKYPKGWHFFLDEVNGAKEGLYKDYDAVYLGIRPVVMTVFGPSCDFVFYIKSSLADSEAEFNRILESERMSGKKELIEFKEEIIASEHFGSIYRLTGKTQPSDRIDSQKVEKYFFISTEEEPWNRTIVAAELMWGMEQNLPLFQEIVMSFEACQAAGCQEIFE